jgi:Fe-S-cluster containining protein
VFEHPGEDLHFTCSGCGDCCRSTNVPLVGDELERLEALDWSGKVVDLEGAARAVRLSKPQAGLSHRLDRKPDGSCAYLASDNGCLIHRHFGAEVKPLACRLYPFQLRPVGGRVAVDLAFSCSAVSRDEGRPLPEHESDWTALWSEVESQAELAHRLSRKQPLEGSMLLELEQALLGFLENESLGFLERVRCCLDFAKLASTGDPTNEGAAILRDALVKSLPVQVKSRSVAAELDKTQRAVFYQWLYLATNPPPAGVDQLASNKLRIVERARVLAGNLYRSGDNRPTVANEEIAASYDEIARVDASVLDGDESSRLRRFFVAKLVGQRWLLEGEGEAPFASAVPMLFLWFPMALWTAKAFAADKGAKTATDEDLRRALRLLDPPLGQLTPASLPKPQRKVCDFVFLETDLVVDASAELLGLPPAAD